MKNGVGKFGLALASFHSMIASFLCAREQSEDEPLGHGTRRLRRRRPHVVYGRSAAAAALLHPSYPSAQWVPRGRGGDTPNKQNSFG